MTEKVYEKDLEYKTHYADGIIFQIKDNVGKLIFYQEETNPNDTGNELELEKKNIKMILEIRIPEPALSILMSHYTEHKKFIDWGLNIASIAKSDKSVVSKWTNYDTRISKLVMDTSESFPYEKLNNITDLSEDLFLKSYKTVKKNTDTFSENTQKGDENNVKK